MTGWQEWVQECCAPNAALPTFHRVRPHTSSKRSHCLAKDREQAGEVIYERDATLQMWCLEFF